MPWSRRGSQASYSCPSGRPMTLAGLAFGRRGVDKPQIRGTTSSGDHPKQQCRRSLSLPLVSGGGRVRRVACVAQRGAEAGRRVRAVPASSSALTFVCGSRRCGSVLGGGTSAGHRRCPSDPVRADGQDDHDGWRPGGDHDQGGQRRNCCGTVRVPALAVLCAVWGAPADGSP